MLINVEYLFKKYNCRNLEEVDNFGRTALIIAS